MRLRHFLLGTDHTHTRDYAFLAKSSDVTEAELKFWKPRLRGLTGTLRDMGAPADDFIRLFVPGQNDGEWAYIRIRTGGYRAGYDLHAVILGSETLEWLRWQPWALDKALFDGNTLDPRVQELGRQSTAPPPEYDPPVVELEFNGRVGRPRLDARQKETVERMFAHLEGADAETQGLYVDEGELGAEGARDLIAGLLMRLHEQERPVPGFIMGLPSAGAAQRKDARLPDIRLASYKKEPGGFFPFENWRDAAAEQLATAEARRTAQSPPRQPERSHAQTGPLGPRDQSTLDAAAADVHPAGERAARSEEETRRQRQQAADGRDDPHTSISPEAASAGVATTPDAESSQTSSGQFHVGDKIRDGASGRSSRAVDKDSTAKIGAKRDKTEIRSDFSNNGVVERVRDRLDQPLPLKVTLLAVTILLLPLCALSYAHFRTTPIEPPVQSTPTPFVQSTPRDASGNVNALVGPVTTPTASSPEPEATPIEPANDHDEPSAEDIERARREIEAKINEGKLADAKSKIDSLVDQLARARLENERLQKKLRQPSAPNAEVNRLNAANKKLQEQLDRRGESNGSDKEIEELKRTIKKQEEKLGEKERAIQRATNNASQTLKQLNECLGNR